jgi:hypothetical protein
LEKLIGRWSTGMIDGHGPHAEGQSPTRHCAPERFQTSEYEMAGARHSAAPKLPRCSDPQPNAARRSPPTLGAGLSGS